VTSARTRTPIPFPREQLQLSNLGSHHVSDTLSRMPAATVSTDHVHTHTLPRRPVTAVSDQLRAFPRSLPEPACTQSPVTSMLPCQLHIPHRMPTRPPPTGDVLISALPRPLTAPSEEVLTSALPRSPTLVGPPSREDVVTSALPHPPTAPADFAYDTMQRPADRVDRNVYTNSSEQLLAELPSSPPPHVCRQPIVPLSPVCTQATANLYENTDVIPSLSAHRYADIPLYINTSPYSSAPLSQPIALGQSNVTQPSALYAASYTSDLHSSGLIALNPNIARSSYVDNSQRLPIVVEQPGVSAFSRVDVHHSRPAVADSTVQCTVCTLLPSATADHVRPTVTAHTAPLQSPLVHSTQRFPYDYIQPDTELGAPTHAAPAIHSGYIRPQTSDTHTHTLK